MWAHGGFPCGEYPDLKMARETFALALNDGERSMADKGYRDERYFLLPNSRNNKKHKVIMSRHETVNKRIRQFQSLKQIYRHDRQKHPMVFHAVLNLTQLLIENGEPLFTVI